MTAEERYRAGIILAKGDFVRYERSTGQQDRAGIDDYMLGLAIQRKTRSKAYGDILIELGHDGIEAKGWWFTRAADVTIYFTPAWVAAWRTSEQTDDAAVDFAHRFPCFQAWSKQGQTQWSTKNVAVPFTDFKAAIPSFLRWPGGNNA